MLGGVSRRTYKTVGYRYGGLNESAPPVGCGMEVLRKRLTRSRVFFQGKPFPRLGHTVPVDLTEVLVTGTEVFTKLTRRARNGVKVAHVERIMICPRQRIKAEPRVRSLVHKQRICNRGVRNAKV